MEQEYTQNLLVDNSKPSLQMVGLLKKLIANPSCNRIRIATGYWDLPGTNLVYDELKVFLERGGRLDILIGQEPMLFPYQRRFLAVVQFVCQYGWGRDRPGGSREREA